MTTAQSDAKRGTHNPRAKLTEAQVEHIRELAANPEAHRGWKIGLAKLYHVSPATITGVIQGATWGSVSHD